MDILKVNGFEARLRAMSLEFNFQEICFDLKKKLLQQNQVLDKILHDESLKILLTYSLAVGNFLNGDSNKGDALGFKLDSIEKTADTKSFDNKQTALMYIVKKAELDTKKELVDVSDQLEDLQNFSKINLGQLEYEIKELKRGQENVSLAIKSSNQSNELDRVEIRFKGFYAEITKRLVEFEEEMNRCKERFSKACIYYGEDPQTLTSDALIQKIMKFKKLCQQAKQQTQKLENLKEREEEKKRLQELQKQKQNSIRKSSNQIDQFNALVFIQEPPIQMQTLKVQDKQEIIDQLKLRRSSKVNPAKPGASSLQSLMEMQKKLKNLKKDQ